MKSYFLSSLLLSVLFLSCKDDKTAEKSEKKVEKLFIVTCNAIVEKDDIFQIFYNEDGGDNFAPEDAVTLNVKGSSEPQDLVFVLPQDVSPMNLRFDIGANPDLKQVAFKRFRIDYRNNSFSADNGQFIKYFYPNPPIEFDSINVVARLKAVDGVYDPILSSTINLKEEIVKLYEKKQ